MATTFAHEPDARRYTLRIDDQLIAVADYVINDDSISFNHTYTQPSQRGHGYAGDVVEYAVNDVEANSSRRIVPMCWYVGQWFDQHPERAGLLARGTA
jgi:predicted GNAT family acetyltransferase